MLGTLEDKTQIAISVYETNLAKLNADIGIANEYSAKEPHDITDLNSEIITAEEMKKHLNEYKRMATMQVRTRTT